MRCQSQLLFARGGRLLASHAYATQQLSRHRPQPPRATEIRHIRPRRPNDARPGLS
ncbi:MAG TPA: hypothetical protein VGB05_05230 [Pyrinomonadaceae bacterium]